MKIEPINYALRQGIAPLTVLLGTLLLVLTHQVNAAPKQVQSVFEIHLELHVANQPAEQVFVLIEKTTEFRFAYDDELLDNLGQVSLQENNLGDALLEISKQLGLRFRQVNSVIAVTKARNVSREKQVEVIITERNLQGKIVDESGEPLVGATVLVTGTQNGTITDVEGSFNLSVPEEAESLTISFIGYQGQVIRIGDRDYIEVVLETDQQALDEVVVVGYGTKKRSDFTGVVSTVPEERLEKVPNLNVAQALQGSVPGVTITQNQAGAASSESIIIRGRNSILANNSPLIVLDGIPYPGSLRDINVNDIESIEVLRDASSTAIYGSRGANGVVLITTKEGTFGRPRITYDGWVSADRYDRLPNYMSGPEFLEFKEIREPGNVTATEQANVDAGDFVDWQDLGTRNGRTVSQNIAVSGRSKHVNYYLGANYLDVRGVSINDDYERITGRANLDIHITDWLTIGTRTQYSTDDRSGLSPDFADLGRKNPLINAYDEDGRLSIYPWPEFTDIGNPLEPINYMNTDEASQLISNNYLLIDFPFLEGLTYRLNVGVTERNAFSSTYRGRNTKEGLESGGNANTSRSRLSTVVVENILDYNREFGVHGLGITALYSYQKDLFTADELYAEGFPNDITQFYNAAQAQFVLPTYDYVRTDLISNMLRLNYAFDQRYLFTLTGRRDGYSGFGEDEKWGTFGTVALGWVLSRESFFNVPVIDFLKLRASYGSNGNQAVAPYQSIAKFQEKNFVSGSTSQPGVIPENLANPTLSWETSRSFNLGLDFGVLENHLTGTINYFNTNTEDLLLNRTISPVNGVSSITDNVGETKNNGLELALNGFVNLSEDFRWSANFNYTHITNEIVSLGLGQQGEVDDVASGLFIGEPITSNFDFLFAGVWQLDEADEASQFGTQPGYIKIQDTNGDGEITAEDRTLIGQTDPTNIWGLNTSFSFKQFQLTFFIHGVHGVTKENRLFQDASSSSGVRRNVILKNWWTPDNPTNDFFANDIDAGQQQGFSAPIYQDASFVRFKDITLSYSLPMDLTNRISMNDVTFYVTGRNLITITDWEETDPELDAGRGTIPLQKSYLVGLSISF